MNKEILFRGISINTDEYVYGNFFNAGNIYYILEPIRNENVIYDLKNNLVDTHIFHRIKPETLSQYIGIKDKNNEMIFDNDYVLGNFPYAKKCKVIYDNKRCGFYLLPITPLGRAGHDKYYKVNSAKLELLKEN